MTDMNKSSPTWHGTTALTPNGNTRQVISSQAGGPLGLNLTMDELTHSAYDLTSGVTSVFSQHTTHLSVPNLTTNNVTYVAPDLSRNVFSHDLMAVTGDE